MYLSVRVIPDAKKERVEELAKGRLRVWVAAPAKHNAANRRTLALVAAHLTLPLGKVRLVSGHHSPSKILDVDT